MAADVPASGDLVRITQKQLDGIVEQHAMYLKGVVGGARATLKFSDLSDLDLSGKDLSQADFTGSRFVGTDLSRGRYTGACFFACDLRNANMARSDFSRADFRGAFVAGADLTGANMAGVDLRPGKIMKKGDSGALVDHERAGEPGT
ncbi:MAG TPA: pentapeptide repeat-containing protein, partial [Alphaproteobacteria bacterium]|nr:pentapeptide repeat-containing protein [Alphaproteobacteria bacterium]